MIKARQLNSERKSFPLALKRYFYCPGKHAWRREKSVFGGSKVANTRPPRMRLVHFCVKKREGTADLKSAEPTDWKKYPLWS